MPRRAFLPLLGLLALFGSPGRAQAPAADFRWQGLARRNPGLVVFRSRWNEGQLELKDDLLRWTDGRDPGKNLVLPVRRLLKHELLCPGASGAPCTEWRVLTKTETYVFRESPPGGGTLRRAFDALRGAYGDLPSSETR